MTVGFFSFVQFPFDLTVVAALLAVIGYSLNDTVVAFDRIRENFFKLRGVNAEESMNTSINEMLARTLITGVIVGTYSSIYTAGATALALEVTAQDLIEPVKDPDLIDDLP